MNRYNNKMQGIINGFNQLQPGGMCDFNMKCDNGFLISRINSSIMIKFHQHPLYSCFSPLRANSSQFWTCNYCGSKYNYTVPSFYCTACDYDLCQKCLIQCQLYEIIMYDYTAVFYLQKEGAFVRRRPMLRNCHFGRTRITVILVPMSFREIISKRPP